MWATYVDDRPTGATTAAKMSLADTTCGGVWDELSAWLSSTCTAEGSPWNWHARDHAPGQQTARERPNNSSRCTHRLRNKLRGGGRGPRRASDGSAGGTRLSLYGGQAGRWAGAVGCGRTGRQAAGRWRERRRQQRSRPLVGEKEDVVLLAGAFTAGRSDSRSCSLLRLSSSSSSTMSEVWTGLLLGGEGKASDGARTRTRAGGGQGTPSQCSLGTAPAECSLFPAGRNANRDPCGPLRLHPADHCRLRWVEITGAGIRCNKTQRRLAWHALCLRCREPAAG